MFRNLIILLSLCFISLQPAHSCSEDGSTGIIEENDMWIPPGDKNANKAIDEKVFNEVIDSVVEIYAPIIKEKGAKLVVQRKWEDGTVNAYAKRSGSNYIVAMFGGLARHKSITADGFALVVCHEIGHHIGGAPKKRSWFSTSWASNEGQADYFATLKCLRKVFEKQDNEVVIAEAEVSDFLVKKCEETYEEKAEQLICIRGGLAGQSVSNFFSVARNIEVPKFDTPDQNVVSRTNHNHPKPQCRMDTYFQGALCDIEHTVEVDQKDAKVGTCNRSQDYKVGIRPLCWYKPRGS